jgi:hypothetical protein
MEITSEKVLSELEYLRAVLESKYSREEVIKALCKVVSTYQVGKGINND